jgi:thiamine biosynthesis lipoprotein
MCLLLGAALYVGLQPSETVQVDSGFKVVMGTFSRAVAIASSEKAGQAAIAAAFDEQRRVDELMSYYDPDSELNTVNREAYQRAVTVEEATFEVLEKALHFSEVSGGAFDVTIGALGELWRRAAATDTVPTEAEIAKARSRVGYDKLRLDPAARTVRFAVEGVKIDLGGIAKGFAIDKAVEAMKAAGAVGGMIDIGGDIRCFGRPPEGQQTWRVGLQDPNVAPDDMATGKPLFVLEVRDRAVTTSGDYRRFATVKGQRQSHIMDTRSGRGADALASVTIIAPDATSADALATAVSVLGLEKGLALIEQVPDTEAILIGHQKDAQAIFTTGAEAYLQ